MEASTLSFIQWQYRHRAFRACEISIVPTRKPLPQLCVISTFSDEISRFPVFCGQQFFRPKVTVGQKFYACESPYYGSTLRVKSVKTWRSTATNQLSNRKPGARSRNFGSKPEPEVVLAAILDSKSAKCRENARLQRRNVRIAVPLERALTEVQFGVPLPERK